MIRTGVYVQQIGKQASRKHVSTVVKSCTVDGIDVKDLLLVAAPAALLFVYSHLSLYLCERVGMRGGEIDQSFFFFFFFFLKRKRCARFGTGTHRVRFPVSLTVRPTTSPTLPLLISRC